MYTLMKHVNNDSQINVPPSPSLTPSSLAMNAPQRLPPAQLPDPWLLDTESLLSELARVRGLALNIPAVRKGWVSTGVRGSLTRSASYRADPHLGFSLSDRKRSLNTSALCAQVAA